jgi:hypothetical protein
VRRNDTYLHTNIEYIDGDGYIDCKSSLSVCQQYWRRRSSRVGAGIAGQYVFDIDQDTNNIGDNGAVELFHTVLFGRAMTMKIFFCQRDDEKGEESVGTAR